jgi:diguanylate cyclase (GGDEF)-like protein/PAS domain S-box-containing protein
VTVGEGHSIEDLLGVGLEPAKLLLGSMPDVALVVDRDGRILYVNREPGGEPMTGTTLFDHDLGADAEARMRAALHQVFNLAKPMSYEVESRADDPDERAWYMSRWSPIERDGEVVSALIIASDITRRVRLEHELARTSHIGAWEWEPDSGDLQWSEELYAIYGVDRETFVPTYDSFLRLIHPDDRDFVELVIRRAVETGEPFSIDERIVRPDGEERVLLSTGRAERPENGGPARLVGVCLDITERKHAEEQLEHVRRQQEAILESAAEGIVGLDADGRVVFANRAAADLLGAEPDALTGRDVHDVVHTTAASSAHDADACPLLLSLRSGLTQHMEDDVFWRQDGAGFPVTFTSSPIVERGELTGTVLTFNDVTERKRFEAQLQYLADHDAVTGLYNRRRFEQELARRLAYDARRGSGGAVLALDLDNFKHVNDTLGHKAGDEVISRVARGMAERIREQDTLARLGGDEFAVLVPEAGIEQAQAVARSVLEAVRAEPIVVGGQELRVTGSVGITTFGSRDGVTGEELLVEADLAMYDAKAAGRDRCALYTPMAVREAQIESRLAWVGRVRTALEEERFALHAQPVVSVETGAVVQHELLLRMVHDGEAVLPGVFLPSAERFGLMPAVDRWVAGEAIDLLARCDSTVRLEVNVSGESMGDEALIAALRARLAETRVEPSRLVLEASESAVIANLERARQFARRVKELGCEFALDDFGAGFGSFYYLKYVPFDYLKIDGDFIHSLPASRADQLVVQALAGLARGLGKRTVAEYVGDDDTLAVLRDAGVDLAQGHHVGRPAPVSAALLPPLA